MNEVEKEFKDYISQISSKIDIYDFNSIVKNYKYSLRYELGGELNNGTKKRVKQATDRAIKLFENCFWEDNYFYILVYDWEQDFMARTPNYLNAIINQEGFSVQRDLAIVYNEGEEPEFASGKFSIYKLKKDQIDYPKILKAIANTDMGFDPCIHQIVFFFGMSSLKMFWMYDDRGCLIFSHSINSIKPQFSNFKNWLVEGYEEYFNSELKHNS